MLDGSLAAAKRIDKAARELLDDDAVRYRRLWSYYSNPHRAFTPTDGSARSYRQAQEWGMPPRITGFTAGREPFGGVPTTMSRKEVVVENDIGWRIDTNVDFLFGRPFTLESIAPDPKRAKVIGDLLRSMIASNGGLGFLQTFALVGSIYGSADVLVKVVPESEIQACDVAPFGGGIGDGDAETTALANRVRLELVEPARSLPILHPDDGSRACAYLQAYSVPLDVDEPTSPHRDWLVRFFPKSTTKNPREALIVEAVGPRGWQVYRDGRLVDEGTNPLGRLPLAHVQNVARPFAWSGAGDVEPLIPLQDELNTRLSDRAGRIALQASRMYLGVGIDNFLDQKIAPGQMWQADNPDARVFEFGGSATNPGENDAIREAREALDKASGVNPAASGAIRGRIGNLTSASALRLTFQSLLARTDRKRANYGNGIANICQLALASLDALGLFATTPQERRVRITWPDPIPADDADRLEQARLKRDIGVSQDVILRELGYGGEAAATDEAPQFAASPD